MNPNTFYLVTTVKLLNKKMKKSLFLLFLAFMHSTLSWGTQLILSDEKGQIYQIPEQSILQGSSENGGGQPSFLIDFDNSAFDELKKELDQIILNNQISYEEKLFQITQAVHKALPHGEYGEPKLKQLNKLYLNLKKPIPISEYIKIKSGVCRENAIILYKSLEYLKIPSQYYYAKIERAFSSDVTITEDHAFVVINHQSKKYIIDSYFPGFNGFNFEQIKMGYRFPEKLAAFPHYNEERSIIKLNTYPLLWIPVQTQIKCPNVFN